MDNQTYKIPAIYLIAIVGLVLTLLLLSLALCFHICKRRIIKDIEVTEDNVFKPIAKGPNLFKSSKSNIKSHVPESYPYDNPVDLLLPTSPDYSSFSFRDSFKTASQVVQPDENVEPFHFQYARSRDIPDLVPDCPMRKKEDFGMIQFSICFDVFESVIVATVYKACGLQAAGLTSEITNPFAELHLYPGKRCKMRTKACKRTLNPIWNEVFTFEGLKHEDLKGKYLYIDVITCDKYSRSNVLGSTELELAKIAQEHRDVCLEHVLHPSKNSRVFLGDLLISLCYLSKLGQISLVVMKCTGLRINCPYVKINVLHSGKKIAKKKTLVKKETTEPVWNETLVFDVPITSVDMLTLELKIMDYDAVLPDKCIAQTSVGNFTTGSALKHWTDMLTNPDKPIASWHTVYDI